MYNLTLTESALSNKEQEVFSAYLTHQGLDPGIWQIYDCLFQSGDPWNTPLMLRVYQDEELAGAAVVVQCKKYGRALFNNPLLSGMLDTIKIPFYLWIKFGCCMDMLSNPGFFRDPDQSEEVLDQMVTYLEKNSVLTIIYDYSDQRINYRHAAELPALPQGYVSTAGMKEIEDYLGGFKNIRKKLRTFKKKGGVYERIPTQLSAEKIDSLTRCFIATANSSVFYLPYQQLYLRVAQKTSRTPIDQVHYFVAIMDGELIGYQAAIQTGKYLNALHGAFDRNRRTTWHAYDLLFVKMTEFAIENSLDLVDFGAILNYTKQKMVNHKRDLSYFILSQYHWVKWLFSVGLKWTKIQGREQFQFLDQTDK